MEFIRINTTRDTYWEQAWEIYEQSFPVFERRLFDNQVEAMKEESYNCVVVVKNDGVVGMIFYWEWEESIYIEHFAIHSDFRGRNYGSTILKEFVESTSKVVILEIDPPIDEISKRRLSFYKQLGFNMNDYDYSHPPYRKTIKPHALKILSYNQYLGEEMYQLFYANVCHRAMKYVEK